MKTVSLYPQVRPRRLAVRCRASGQTWLKVSVLRGCCQVKVWFQNRRTKNRRTVDEEQSAQVEPGHAVSESSDDSCGDTESQDTSCSAAAAVAMTTTRISPDAARLGREVDLRRHVTSRDDEDDYNVDNHGNRAAAGGGGWTELCRSQTLRHALSPMSTCQAAIVTIGQS